MEKIEWTKELATGIKEIDGQHKVFLSLCGEIIKTAEKNAGSAKIIAFIRKLEKEAEEHFSTEGRLMAETYYTDKKGHLKLHAYFLDELRAVKSRAEAGETGADFAADIRERLAEWFILHIKKNDIKMASYILKK